MNIDIGGMVGGTMAMTLGIIVFSIVLTLLIIFFVFRWVRKYSGSDKASKELLQTGTPAQARIVQMQETGMYINNMPVANILLEIYPTTGQPPFQAWVRRRIPPFQMMQYQIGATVPVRFNPSDPTKVAIAM